MSGTSPPTVPDGSSQGSAKRRRSQNPSAPALPTEGLPSLPERAGPHDAFVRKRAVRAAVVPRATSLNSLEAPATYLPQAIFRVPVAFFASRLGIPLATESDDFDSFEGVAFFIDDTPYIARCYAGHPAGTTTIYLPESMCDLAEITERIAAVPGSFGLLKSALTWQRKDDPDL